MWLAVTASYAETQSTCRQGNGAGLWQIFNSSCFDRSTDSSASEGRAQTSLDQLTHKTSRQGKGLLRRWGKSSDLTRHNSKTNKQSHIHSKLSSLIIRCHSLIQGVFRGLHPVFLQHVLELGQSHVGVLCLESREVFFLEFQIRSFYPLLRVFVCLRITSAKNTHTQSIKCNRQKINFKKLGGGGGGGGGDS